MVKWHLIRENPPPSDGRMLWLCFLYPYGKPRWIYFTGLASGLCTRTDGYAPPSHWAEPVSPDDEEIV